MVPIPAGRFLMGSPANEAGRKADEGPQVEIVMDAFHMAECEVTWDLYNEFANEYLSAMREKSVIPPDKMADAVTYPSPGYSTSTGPVIHRMGGPQGEFPAVFVSRYTAKQFTKWLSKKTGRFYRLPTDAEWEYACRAGTTTPYSFGTDAEKLADAGWYLDNSEARDGDSAYRAVKSKRPNAWGLYDMHGNVAEWVIDGYDADHLAALSARGRLVRWDDAIRWPTTRYPAILRGGNYDADAADCRSAARMVATKKLSVSDPEVPKSAFHEFDAPFVGFRVVSPAMTPPVAEQRKYWDAEDPQTIEKLSHERTVRGLVETTVAAPTTNTTTVPNMRKATTQERQ